MYSNLSALYLSLKRLSEVVDSRFLRSWDGSTPIASVSKDSMLPLRVISEAEDGAIAWLQRAKLPTLGELMIEGRCRPGAFFTHYGAFTGSGILKAVAGFQRGESISQEARIVASFDTFHPRIVLTIQAHPANFTANSSSGEMSGKHRLFVVGRLTDVDLPKLRAQAYLIGHVHAEPRPPGNVLDRFNRLPWQMEVYLSDLAPLGQASDEPMPTKAELQRLRDIPESDVKDAFAEVIGEPFVPVDWGGESSDLVSAQMRLFEMSVTTAFAFKGPSKFKPLTVGDLGKRGDQIGRLFHEAADLVVLQHCHEITGAVRETMRAFATRFGQLKPFCLIDGAATVRIMRHFKKLGFS